MAEYKVEAGQIGSYGNKLVAKTVDTVLFEEKVQAVRIYSNGEGAIYFTTNGNVPTVKGAGTYEIPATVSALTVEIREGAGATLTVKLISEGTPTYSASVAQVNEEEA